jgi:hypothetical protein
VSCTSEAIGRLEFIRASGPTKSWLDLVALKLTRVEAAALLKATDVGLRIIDALALVQRTAATEAAISKLKAAVAVSEHV